MAIRPSYLLPSLLVSFAGACATHGAHAAELGEARVASHIGQPLVADVELTLIEEPGTPVGARLAHPNVYRGANIAMPPVLGSLDMVVTRREGRQFLHLTSIKPVDSRHLHVYLELTDGAQRSVRLVTLWLTPDPHPAQAQAQDAAPLVPSAPAMAALPPAATPATVPKANEEEGKRPQRAAAAPATKRPVSSPPAPPRRATHAAPAVSPKDAQASLPAQGEAAASACAPQPSAQENACVALNAKNAALRQTLDRLEDRVKGLQAAHGVVPVGAQTAAAQEAPRIQRKPKKPIAPEPETPWLLIGGAVGAVLALGGLGWWLRRRRGARIGKLPAAGQGVDEEGGAPPRKPGFVAALKARLMLARRKRAASGASAQEPQLACAQGAEPVPATLE